MFSATKLVFKLLFFFISLEEGGGGEVFIQSMVQGRALANGGPPAGREMARGASVDLLQITARGGG